MLGTMHTYNRRRAYNYRGTFTRSEWHTGRCPSCGQASPFRMPRQDKDNNPLPTTCLNAGCGYDWYIGPNGLLRQEVWVGSNIHSVTRLETAA